MSPRLTEGQKFERKLARMFRRLGYHVEETKGSNDHGADLIIRKRRKKIAVQAKCYSSPVGNSAVQEVFAAQAFYEADAAWVVTNSTFTSGAVAQAKPCKVKLIDGAKLKRMRKRSWFRKLWPLVPICLLAAFIVVLMAFPDVAAKLSEAFHKVASAAADVR